ncbi:hypothetical protein PIB30_074478, partial [Stylosanthes scabra]|nr:hypothetical protein [Stylosanthes scabra]
LGPRIRGDGHAPHEPDVDFFSGTDLELARFILHGEDSGSKSTPHASAVGTSVHQYGPPNEMYEVFWCGEQTMDHIAHEDIASCTSNDAVYRLGPPLQPHPDPAQQCQGFQYYQPLQQSYLQPSPQEQYQLPLPHCQSYYHPSPQLCYQSPLAPQQHFQPPFSYHTPSPQPQFYQSASKPSLLPPQHDDPSYQSALESSAHQIVRPRAQRPQRDRHPPQCGTSSHLHHRPAHGADRD